MRIDAIASGAVCYLNLLKSVADGAQIVAAHLGGLERRTSRGLILLDEQGRELGLHLIWIPHDLMDPRTVSRRTMRDTVSSYMDTVMHATPVDETLLDFADDVCM